MTLLNKKKLFTETRESLFSLGLPHSLDQLHKEGIHIRRDSLGGSHSVVTYPPLDALEKIEAPDLLLSQKNSAHLYIHIPFCETLCTFCPYIVKHYSGSREKRTSLRELVDDYVNLISHELVELGKRGISFQSIYIGGGTPLILSFQQLHKILQALSTSFPLEKNLDFCVEGSPRTIMAPDGKEKLLLLKNFKVNRMSFGIQSFQNDVLQYSGRGYKTETALEACKTVSKIFENWNIDLIQGLYKGNVEEVWNNMFVLETVKPPHITWYHGRFRKISLDAKRRLQIDKLNEYENEWDTLFGRMLIWKTLEKFGYSQIDGNRFVRNISYKDPFKGTRTSISNTLIGIGPSAYSHNNDWFTRNHCDIMYYMQSIKNNTPRSITGLLLNDEEKIAASYVIGLRNLYYETPEIHFILKKNPTLWTHYSLLVEKLLHLHILEECQNEFHEKSLRLSRGGRLFEDEILALFYSPSVQVRLLAQGEQNLPRG